MPPTLSSRLMAWQGMGKGESQERGSGAMLGLLMLGIAALLRLTTRRPAPLSCRTGDIYDRKSLAASSIHI